MNPVAKDILMHYGVSVRDGSPGRGSGRYPWGSGDSPFQHSGDFISRVEKLKKEGLTENEIARMMGFVDEDKYGRQHVHPTKLRAAMKIAKDERRGALVARAKELREQGLSYNQIAAEMGYKNDSSVRSLLNERSAARTNLGKATADILKAEVEAKGFIDVSSGVERELGITSTRLDEALSMLEMEGYQIYNRRRAQVTNPRQSTTLKVLCPPGTEYSDVYDDTKIHSLRDYISHDGGDTYDPLWVYPKSMDSKRLMIRYDEEGGTLKDGVIELRRGVDDLSLGNSHYAQVRILVDGTHYLKGMAIYSDDMPPGVDVIFNTNKKSGTPMTKVLKEITSDPENPFGSLIKPGIDDPDDPTKRNGGQSYYIDKDGKKQLSLINKRAAEGDWGDWKDTVPAQFLAKQPLELINRQLNLAIDSRTAEYREIISYNNPTVRKVLLRDFADNCDAAAEHLKAAALPRQKYHVLLPFTTIKDTEVYAPNYRDGETVALIRFPHAGTFEIPILKVNNKLPEGLRTLGKNPKDAVGISKKVADQLSGADFDGDAVMVIPCNSQFTKTRITAHHPLDALVNFETKSYGPDEEYKDADGNTHYIRNGREYTVMSEGLKQTQMGVVSNLITDMTLMGASDSDKAKAVKHSMVVIDAVKHHLDYKQSEIENDIQALKNKYQGHYDEDGVFRTGASTIISRAKNEVDVDKRQGSPRVNLPGKPWYDPSRPEGVQVWKTADDVEYEKKVKVRKTDPVTGKYLKDEKGNYIYETTIDTKTGKTRYVYEGTGKIVRRTQKSTQMAETDDAYTLVSAYQTPEELAYARYANTMKAMANQARKEEAVTGKIPFSASAKSAYKEEVASLNAKLNVALKNAPREREAQRIATINVDAKIQANPDMTKSEIKKARQQALAAARTLVGAERHPVIISDKEWEAIQAGAVSEHLLLKILENANVEQIKEFALPRDNKALNDVKIQRIRTLASNGYTNAEIANAVGVSASTVAKYL